MFVGCVSIVNRDILVDLVALLEAATPHHISIFVSEIVIS